MSVVRWLAARRYNFIDAVGIVMFADLLLTPQWYVGVAGVVGAVLLGHLLERKVGVS